MRNFRELKEKKEAVVGLFINAMCPEFLEIAAYAGFDFAILDNEHGAWDGESFAHLIRACDAAGILPLVRVSKTDETEIKKALDSGAAGVMIPGISTPEQAKEALRLSKFAPEGLRGACPYVRANKFNAGDKRTYFDKANRTVSVIMLIEGKEGLENYDRILEVEGVDCVFFGPCDLSNSLGHAGDENHPEVKEAIGRMIRKAKEKNVWAGMMGFDGEDSRRWLEAGAGYVAALSDVGLFYDICRKTVDEVKG